MEARSVMQPGEVLGDRYRIVMKIGEGGMSTVYLADDLKLPGKKWAVKATLNHLTDAEQWVEEAKILTRLDHPQLPQIVDFFAAAKAGEPSYLVLEYIRGVTLETKFEAVGKKMEVEAVVGIAQQICEIFDYLHHVRPQPVIYRDLKPSNIMVDDDGRIRLIDFGIARHYKNQLAADTVRIGTIGFAAPEQFGQAQTDGRTDLYALGAVMYYLLSGGSYYCISRMPLEKLCSGLPCVLAAIVTKLLQADPMLRYQSAAELRTDLSDWSAASTSSFSSPPSRSKLSASVPASTSPPVHIVPRKLIVVGGLCAGAGATFVAFALSRLLNAFCMTHAVVEYPLNEPEHYTLLSGERNAPADYIFIADQLAKGASSGLKDEWLDGDTIWYPANPQNRLASWSTENMFKLFYSVKTSFILLDISHRWDDPIVQEVCSSADELICVAAASPAKLNRPSSVEKARLLQHCMAEGKAVHWVGNRAPVRNSQRTEWLHSLPSRPKEVLPEFEHEKMMDAAWRGRLPQDDAAIRTQLEQALVPLLRRMLPESKLHIQTRRNRALFAWFGGRKKD